MTIVGTIQQIIESGGGYVVTLVTGTEFAGPAIPVATTVKVSITRALLSQFALQGFQATLDRGTDFLIGRKVEVSTDESKTGGKLPGYKIARSIGFPVGFGSDVQDQVEQKTGGPAQWPQPTKTSPFTPIPTPYLAMVGANVPGSKFNKESSFVEGFRIGYAIVPVDCQHFNHQRSSYIRQAAGLRMKDSIKTTTGMGYESYSLVYTVDGAYEIAAGVRDVFEQIALMPFISAEGGPFGARGEKGVIPFKDIAVRSYGLSTIPGMPGSLQVQLDFDPFLWDWWKPYSEGSEDNYEVRSLDDAVCYPLFKIWCKTVGRSQYHSIPGTLPTQQVLDSSKALNGRLIISVPSTEAVQQIEALLSSPSIPSDGTDSDIARSARGLLAHEYGDVVSDNVKEIVVGTGNRYLAIKVNDPTNFAELTGLLPNPGSTTGISYTDAPGEQYLGLVEWSRLSSFKYADAEGNRVPKGSVIGANQIPLVDATILGYASVPSGIVDIPLTTDFPIALREWLIARERRMDPLISDAQAAANADALYPSYLAHPEQYFAVLLVVTGANKQKVEAKLGSMASRSNLQYNAGTKSYNDQIFQIFDRPGAVDTSRILTVRGAEEDPSIDQEIIVQQISAMRTHSLSVTSVQGLTLPIHSYLGSMGAVFTITGHCFGIKAKRVLEQLKEEFDNRAVKRTSAEYDASRPTNEIDLAKKRAGTPFFRVENEIFQLMGCNFAMPVTLTFDSVDGMPDAYQFTLTMIDYDPRINQAEKVKYLPTVNQQTGTILAYGFPSNTQAPDGSPADNPGYHVHPTILKARDFFSLQAALRYERLFPDLELPTKSELNRWVISCNKVAKSRLTNSDPSVALDPFDKRIESIIDQFISSPLAPYSVKLMSRWDTAPGPLEGGMYCDPDFYYFYHSTDDFGNMLDAWTKKVLGKPTDNMAAGEREAGGADPVRRSFDTEHNVISMTHPDHIGANVASGADHLERVLDNTFDLYTGQRATEIRAAEDEINAKRLNVGKSLGWWVAGAGLEDLANGQRTVQLVEGAFAPELTDDLLIPQETAVDPKDKDSFDVSKVNEEYLDFFRLTWRQRMLRQFAEQGRSRPQAAKFEGMTFTEGNFLIPVGDQVHLPDWQGPSEPNEMGLFNNLAWVKKRFYRTDRIQLMNSISAWSGYINDHLTARQLTFHEWFKDANPDLNEISLVEDREITQQFLQGRPGGHASILVNQPSFLERVYLANQSYAYWKRNRVIPVQSVGGGSLVDRHKSIYETIDCIAAQYNVDPHIVRAYFQVRSGLGSTATNNNQYDGGWGDLDLESTQLQPAAPYTDFLVKFCEVYNKYSRRFNGITSFALIAADAELTSKGRNFKQGGALAFEKTLQAAAYRIPNAKSRSSAAEIQSTLKTIEIGTDMLCLYYTAWVEISRIFGPIVDGGIGGDCFFSPDNPLIVMDVGKGFKPSVFGDNLTMETNFAPCAGNILVRASRGVTGESALVNLSKQDPQISAEARAAMLGRNRVAISPASEDSIYGMLHDLRKYSPHGRLIGAFPAYLILFINEGFYWLGGGQKLWDQYYTRTAVTAIEVFKSRQNPGDVATVTLSNVFHQLTRYAAQEALLNDLSLREKQVFKQRVENMSSLPGAVKTFGDLWSEFVLKNPSEQLKKIWQKNFLNVLVVGAGARLHIRMGYGSDASKLPIVFNGTIVEAPVDDGAVTVLAIGDGAELEKPSVNKLYKSANGYAYVDQGLLGAGKSPSNIVVEALINLEGVPALLAKATGGSYFRDWSHGIMHFGDVYLDGLIHHPAETQINLYDASLTAFEQGVPAIKNYFLTHALYDWRGENTWFSVNVSEPTPWKVIETCRRAVSDFVASAEPMMTQSTVFFGKWWWPFNYAFAPSILDVNFTPTSKLLDKLPPPDSKGKVSIMRKPLPKRDPVDKIPLMDTDLIPIRNALDKYNVLTIDRVGTTENFPPNVWAALGVSLDAQQAAGYTRQYYLADLQEKAPSAGLYTAYFFILVPKTGLGLSSYFPRKDAMVIIPSKDRSTVQEIYKDIQNQNQIKDSNFPSKELIAADQVAGNNSLRTGFDTLKDVNTLVSHMIWKPFMQVYFAHSHLNLLSVNIKTDATNVFTDAIGLHTYHGFFTGDAVERNASWCIDDNIQPGDRKTLQVNTGILLTAFEAGIPGLQRKIAGWIPGLSDFVNQVPPTPAIENAVVAALIDTVKEMYQGWMTVTGTPSMKPRDLVLMSDVRTGLSGPVWVKEVIHRMDGQVGFITMISPDCVVVPHSSFQGYRMLSTISTNVGFQFMAWWALRNIFQVSKLSMARYADKNFDAERMYFRAIREELDAYTVGGRSSFRSSFYEDTNNYRMMVSNKLGGPDAPRAYPFTPDNALQDPYDHLVYKLNGIYEQMDAGTITEKEAVAAFKAEVAVLSEKFPDIGLDEPTFTHLNKLADTSEKQAKFFDEVARMRAETRQRIVEQIFKVDEAGDIVRDAAGNPVVRNALLVNSPHDLEKYIADLEHDEWIKFLKRNSAIVEELGLNAVHTEELLKNLAKAEAIETDAARLKKLRALKNVLTKQKIVLTIEDFKELNRILNAPFSEYFELTLKDRKVLEQILAHNSSYFKVIGRGVEGIANIPGKIGSAIVGRGKDIEASAKDLSAMSKLKATIGNIRGATKKIREAEDSVEAVKDTIKLAAIGGKIERGIKDGVMAVRVASYAGPQAVLAIVRDVIFFCIGDSIIDAINQALKSRHTAKIIPLRSGNIPYVAGIRGHQGAVIGDDPGWLDNILMEWVGGKNNAGFVSNPAKNCGLFLAGILGIEVPDWTPSPAEQKYLRGINSPSTNNPL